MNENPTLQLTVRGLDELDKAASAILEFASNRRIILFEGEMGSGKTTLIKKICQLLGSEDHFSSPTFSIINEYSSPIGKLFHFDLYRLTGSAELLDLGAEEYLESGSYCFIEWPKLLKDLVPEKFTCVKISVNEGSRIVFVSNDVWY